MVGGVLAFTVNKKFVAAVSAPSLTVTVMVEVPLPPGAGVMTTFRSAPVPPNVMLAFGTRVVFDEVPEIVKLPGCVSASPIVKAIAQLAAVPFVDWSAIAVIAGGALT